MPAALDPTVASLLDKAQTTQSHPPSHSGQRSRSRSCSPSPDPDDLLATLDDDTTTLATYRASRIAQLTHELASAAHLRDLSHGTLSTLTSEKPLMDTTTSTSVCVVHFFKSDFARCAVMDRHLERLAGPHYECRFLRIDVGNAPFLVERLGVRVLPCVLGFVDGGVVVRIVGFEGLGGGGGDGFETAALEERLVGAGVLVRGKVGDGGADRGQVKVRGKVDDGDEDGDDWD